MIVLWMAYALAVGVLLAVSAWAAEGALRARGLPVRWVWLGALALAIGLPAVAGARAGGWLTADQTNVREGQAGVAGAPGIPSVSSGAAEGQAGGTGSWVDSWYLGVADWVGAERLGSLVGFGLIAWVVTTAILLSVLAWMMVRARAVRSRWPRQRVVGETVRVAPGAGPAVQGIRRPEIILPEWLLAGPESEIRLAVAHEREHVRARDPGVLLAGWVAASLLPWNPVMWWMYSRLRLAVEIDCDHRVLAGGAGRLAYGSMLVDVASRRPVGGLAGATGLAGVPSHLERRIKAMTPRIKYARIRAGLFGAAAALAFAAACDTAMPTADEIRAMDLAAAEDRASRILRTGDTSEGIGYVVDGVVVEREVAEAIDAETIASIEVVRNVAAVDGGRPVPGRLIAIRRRDDSAGGVTGQEVTRLEGDTITLLRDQTSNETGTEPLVIVDGVIVSRSVDLPALDIESVEVIKAAAAERIYGPRAANGVILVNTRAGASRAEQRR